MLNERNLLSKLQHEFIVNIKYAFQDRENLYLVMDLLGGGDLRYHICRHRRFTEEQTMFFAANILHGLEYLHNNSIIHRDIKPENLVFDDQGYIRITDFGIARVWNPDNKKDTSGTPGYMAPEVMCRQNHGVTVDYFALGVIVFECIFGFRPYRGKSRKEIRDQILAKQVKIRRHDIPPGWTVEACDFANKLLQRKPHQRLGLNGPLEVKNHPWFDGFPWHKLDTKQIEAPFVPDQVDNFDTKVTNDAWKDEESDKMKESAILLRRDTVQDLFKGYYYDQSFEGFSFTREEQVKPIQQQPIHHQPINHKPIQQQPVPRQTAHRSQQVTVSNSISKNNSRSSSHMSKQSYTASNKSSEFSKPKRESNQILQRYRPSSRDKSSSKNSQSRNKINFKVPAKHAIPKGPFYYKHDSKKISQI